MHPMIGCGRQRAGRDRHRAATLQSLEDRLLSQFVTTSEVRAVVGGIAAPAGDGYRSRRGVHRRVAAGLGFAAAVRRPRRNAGRRRQHRQRDADLCRVRRHGGADRLGWPCATTCADWRHCCRAGLSCSAAGLCASVVLSLDPGTSIRRFALTVCVMAVAATLMLLPKSQNELMRWFSIAALGIAGDLLSRHLVGAELVDPSGDRCAGAGARRQLARFVRPQERGGRRDGDAAVPRYLYRAVRRVAVGSCHHRPCIAVSALLRRQEFADAVLCGAGADVADRDGSLALGARRDAV